MIDRVDSISKITQDVARGRYPSYLATEYARSGGNLPIAIQRVAERVRRLQHEQKRQTDLLMAAAAIRQTNR